MKGTVIVINIGTFIVQVNASKLRRPLDTVGLEEPPDSCERTEAPVLWLFCEGQIDIWKRYSANSCLSATLDRQGLMVAVPTDQRTKKSEGFSPRALQGFWSKIETKNPKIVASFPTALLNTLGVVCCVVFPANTQKQTQMDNITG